MRRYSLGKRSMSWESMAERGRRHGGGGSAGVMTWTCLTSTELEAAMRGEEEEEEEELGVNFREELGVNL